ncbi:YdcF family protein [Lichenicoccus sp.]|uniref:YdcF family protein n=1 Tax=Lichenicoccus sp. TaxID=2781899 RepID=UPI003D0C269C
MFIAGKLLTMALLPTALLVECVVLGLLLRRWRAGRVLAALGAAGLAACLLLPVDGWAIRPLEDRFPQVARPPPTIDGIVVLGGGIDDLTSLDRGTPVLTSAGNRITSFVILANRYPKARLVFTGGSGSIVQGVSNEARYAREMFDQLGLAPERVTFENRSRTTWENAVMTAALVHPRPGERWVLLTSAAHMPRAVGVFRRAGWSVLPWPVGYLSRDRIAAWPQSLGGKLATLDWAVHEWIGLVAYRLEGHSSALFPAPVPGPAAG